jgi:hypothetical protein
LILSAGSSISGAVGLMVKKPAVSPSARDLMLSPSRFMACNPPAPGVFWITMVGAPAMCFGRCRARMRASVSMLPPTP